MGKVSKGQRERRESLNAELSAFGFSGVRSERTALEEAIRLGARRMLQTAIDAEVDEFLETH